MKRKRIKISAWIIAAGILPFVPGCLGDDKPSEENAVALVQHFVRQQNSSIRFLSEGLVDSSVSYDSGVKQDSGHYKMIVRVTSVYERGSPIALMRSLTGGAATDASTGRVTFSLLCNVIYIKTADGWLPEDGGPQCA